MRRPPRRRLTIERLEARQYLAGDVIMFNDHVAGSGTHVNATRFAGNGVASGFLKDVSTGQDTTITLTASGSGVAYESTSGVPAAGTDAYALFNGYVDFSSANGSSLAVTPTTTYTYAFTGLTPVATYDLAGTSVRGNTSYTNRWTLVTLVGADAFTSAHSTGLGIVTTGLQPNQVALWTGENHLAGQGFIAQWTDIDPGADGQFQLVSTQYQGPTPGVGNGNSTGGGKGYAITGLRLIEHDDSFRVVGSTPANGASLPVAPGSATIDFSGAVQSVSVEAGDLTIDGSAAVGYTILDADSVRFDLPAGIAPGTHTLAIAAGAVVGPDDAPLEAFSANFTVLATASVQSVAATSVTAESASVGAQVTATGGENPALMLFWDTVDRGTDAAAWTHSASLGVVGVGTRELTLTSLLPTTQYFYRSRAVNAAGTSWSAPAASFSTLGALVPTVANLPAANVTATSATLRGDVTSTGNQVPAVTIYYGDDDAGDGTATPWDFNVALGPRSGGFAQFITGLSPLSTYYFRARATNSAGGAWAAPSLSFTTSDIPAATLIINEIHFDPDVKTEPVEFIELFNYGNQPIDVSGWHFTDGIQYTFPLGTVAGPRSYLVVAENPAAVQTKYGVAALGPWAGNLDNDGEQITLVDAAGATQDAVDYQFGFPWPTVGLAPGYSIELIHPTLDNDLGGSWRSSRGSASSGDAIFSSGESWKYFKGTAEPSATTGAWRQILFDDSAWLTGATSIGFGDPFVVTNLTDMQGGYSTVHFRKTFSVADPASIGGLRLETQFDDGLNVWINGTHMVRSNASAIELPRTATATLSTENSSFRNLALLPNPASYLVAGMNVIAVQLINSATATSPDAWFDARLIATAGTGAAGPTPGRLNSVTSVNAAPQMRQAEHSPEQPAAGQDVKVTVKVTDPDGVRSVALEYQLVEPGDYIELADPRYATQWTAAAMLDDGLMGDAVANDDVYTVVLPSTLQTHRRLVRYRITATDTLGRSIRAPYDDDSVPNFAYFVYSGVPAYRGAIQPGSADPNRSQVVTYDASVLTMVPVYHLITTRSDHVESQHIPNATSGVYGGDSYLWNGTLVYDGKVYDHVNYRARGGVWRYAMGKNMWKFDFQRGHDFEARDDYGRKYDTPWTKLNLGANIQQGDFQQRGEQGLFESVGFRLFNLAGSPTSKTNYVHFRIIDRPDETGATQYDGDFQGLYLVVEQLDGRFLDEQGLPDGNLYKMEGGTGEANNIGPAGPTDKSDLNSFMAAYAGTTTDQWWRDNFDLEQYYAYRAMVEAIHHWDIGFGKNYFYYRNPETGKWSEHAWDLDLTWTTTYAPGCGDCEPFKSRVLSRPVFLKEYRNRLREIRDLLFNAEQVGQMLDEHAGFVDTPTAGASLIDADRAMWDYNPILASSYVNANKAGHGRFYQSSSGTFAGMVQKLKNYVATRSAYLDNTVITAAEEAAAPVRPSIAYTGAAGYPANRLSFNTSSFAAGNQGGSFAAMEWRIAEVTDPASPNYDPTAPKLYEINANWESGELTAFASSISIPGDAVEPDHSYRVRVRMLDTNGRWSHWSPPAVFIASPPATSLRISEIMYNPPPQTAEELAAAGNVAFDDQEYEFIEIVNVDAVGVNLSGYAFTSGIEVILGDHTLAPGERAVVVRNPAAFENRYGTGVRIVGVYGGTAADFRLSNAGERLVLSDSSGAAIHDFTYDDDGGWPTMPDGQGPSLVIVNEAADAATWTEGASWRDSYQMLGSPGDRDLLLGDFNLDQRVDGLDLRYLQSRFGVALGATAMTGDLTRDGAIDRADVARFVANFGRAPTPQAPQAVVARQLDRAPSHRAPIRIIATRRPRNSAPIAPAAIDAAIGEVCSTAPASRPLSLVARRLRRADFSL
jgi:hypothetical protein